MTLHCLINVAFHSAHSAAGDGVTNTKSAILTVLPYLVQRDKSCGQWLLHFLFSSIFRCSTHILLFRCLLLDLHDVFIS